MGYLEICRAQLPVDEGCKDKPYKDTEGIWTVGIGRNMEKGFRADEIALMFANDLADAEADARAVCGESFEDLSDARQAVLVNMAFNLGRARLSAFVRMLRAVVQNDFATAADEMLASRWATQVGRRAIRLADMMRKG